MDERRLLERISSLGTNDGSAHTTRAETLVNSILGHLHRILNTRQGSVPVDAAFGVPDFTNLAGSFSTGTTEQIVQDMSRMIQRYEPRLRQPRISFATSQDEVLSLPFPSRARSAWTTAKYRCGSLPKSPRTAKSRSGGNEQMLNRYYEQELGNLRKLGAEFARSNPALAPLLGSDRADRKSTRLNSSH